MSETTEMRTFLKDKNLKFYLIEKGTKQAIEKK